MSLRPLSKLVGYRHEWNTENINIYINIFLYLYVPAGVTFFGHKNNTNYVFVYPTDVICVQVGLLNTSLDAPLYVNNEKGVTQSVLTAKRGEDAAEKLLKEELHKLYRNYPSITNTFYFFRIYCTSRRVSEGLATFT